MNSQTELFTGAQLRDIGMQTAETHANKVIWNWSDRAYNFLCKYIMTHEEFMTEDVRVASIGFVPEPPSLRAWGAIVVRAVRSGVIKRKGFRNVNNAKAHSTPASVWVKA